MIRFSSGVPSLSSIGLHSSPQASRYVYDFPLRADWQQEPLRATLMRELEAAHPVVIIVEAGDFAPDIVGNTMDSKQSMLAFPQLNDYLSKYFKPIAQGRQAHDLPQEYCRYQNQCE